MRMKTLTDEKRHKELEQITEQTKRQRLFCIFHLCHNRNLYGR